MPLLTTAQLADAGTRILAAAGTSPAEARDVATHLAAADAAGHGDEGIVRLPQYTEAIARGWLRPGADVEVVTDRAVVAVLDGHWGYGHTVATRAAAIGLEKAARSGVAALSVRQANHMGRLGPYVGRIAQRGMVGILCANELGPADVLPWGGAEARLGANPVAVGIPRAAGAPLVLDMATSATEGRLPEGRLPFGGAAGYKGYGLGVVVDLLAGALSGAGCSASGSQPGNAAFMMVLDVAHFVPLADLQQQVDELVAFVKSSPRAAGFEEILVPGEAEAAAVGGAESGGIPIGEPTWQQVLGCARALNVSVDLPVAGEA